MQAAPWQGHTGHLQTGPSKWWAWGLAIFLSIQVFFTLIGTIITAIIPYDMLLDDWDVEEPGEYPTNGTSEEQDEWNTTKEEWDGYLAINKMMEEMDGMKSLQIWSGILTCVIGMVAIFMLFQQNPNGFKTTYVWLGISTVTQVWMQYKMQSTMNDLMSNLANEESIWMSVNMGLSLGSTMVCNTLLLMIVIMCSMKSQDKGEAEESGFHRQTILTPEQKRPQP
jgi:hypothetical protein